MNNLTWLITGVSSGFGYEMTKQLLRRAIRLSVPFVTKARSFEADHELISHLNGCCKKLL